MQTRTQGATTTTIRYVGGAFEQVAKTSQPTENVHYLMAAGSRVAVYTTRTDQTEKLRYLHRDHLGSIDTVTDEFGTVVERLA